MIRIYGVASSRTRRCLWTLEEVGAAYEVHRVQLRKGEHRRADYLAVNPNGRIPAMEHEGLVLFESAAICQYIARRYPEAELLPDPMTNEAALHDQWMFWTVTELEQALWSLAKHRFALPEKVRLEGMRETALFEFGRAVKVLAKGLGDREFMLGDQLRLVDIMLGHTLLWARQFKAPFESDGLEAYLDRMTARPAFEATRRHE